MAARSLCLTSIRASIATKGLPQTSSELCPDFSRPSIVSSPRQPWLVQSRGKRSKALVLGAVKPPTHPSAWKDVEFPEATHALAGQDPLAARRLPEIPKVPEYTDWHRSGKPPKHKRELINIRGPELVHNDLVHKQFGIVAEQGGFLRHEHFAMMKNLTDRMLEFDRMFTQYRVDPLYQSWTKRSTGTRMGGGRPAVHHYVTPIKEGRVILEVGGHCTYEEVLRCMRTIAHCLPFAAKVVTHDNMIADKEKEQYLEDANINPFTLDYCIKYNMMGCWKHMSYYDHIWKMKYQ